MSRTQHDKQEIEVLASQLERVCQALSLTTTREIARAVGVDPSSVQGILKRESRPNTRTRDKYQQFFDLHDPLREDGLTPSSMVPPSPPSGEIQAGFGPGRRRPAADSYIDPGQQGGKPSTTSRLRRIEALQPKGRSTAIHAQHMRELLDNLRNMLGTIRGLVDAANIKLDELDRFATTVSALEKAVAGQSVTDVERITQQKLVALKRESGIGTERFNKLLDPAKT